MTCNPSLSPRDREELEQEGERSKAGQGLAGGSAGEHGAVEPKVVMAGTEPKQADQAMALPTAAVQPVSSSGAGHGAQDQSAPTPASSETAGDAAMTEEELASKAGAAPSSRRTSATAPVPALASDAAPSLPMAPLPDVLLGLQAAWMEEARGAPLLVKDTKGDLFRFGSPTQEVEARDSSKGTETVGASSSVDVPTAARIAELAYAAASATLTRAEDALTAVDNALATAGAGQSGFMTPSRPVQASSTAASEVGSRSPSVSPTRSPGPPAPSSGDPDVGNLVHMDGTLRQPGADYSPVKQHVNSLASAEAASRVEEGKAALHAATHGLLVIKGEGPLLVGAQFPYATDQEYLLRACIRRALHRHVAAQKSAARSPRAMGTTASEAWAGVDLLGKLGKEEHTLLKTMLSALEDSEAVDSSNRIRERLSHTLDLEIWADWVRSLGKDVPSSPDALGPAVGALRIDINGEGRLDWHRFVSFLSMPMISPALPDGRVDPESAILYSPQGVPRPATAMLAPPKREWAGPLRKGAWAGYQRVPAEPGKQDSAWEYAQGDTRQHKPAVTVPWPCNYWLPTCPFWEGVNKLEAAVKAEAFRRAEIAGSTPDVLVSAPPHDPVMVQAVDLRRSFAFFDRSGDKCITLNELHLTLAELKLVDPPPRKFTGVAASEASCVEPSLPLEPAVVASMTHAVPVGLVGSPKRPALTSPTKGPRVPALLSPAAAPAAALEGSEDAVAQSALSALGDPAEEEFGQAARALVTCVFRRIHGGTDPGLTRATMPASEDIFREDDPLVKRPIAYNVFSRWAKPLGTKLRKIREAVQRQFRASATIGGGAKDFPRAFRRIDKSGDGIMSVAEFKAALGPLLAPLSPYETQTLVDYFDCDGSGEIDFLEFLGSIGQGLSLGSVVPDEEED